jgi:hypothetical protein
LLLNFDGRKRARLVAGGHIIQKLDTEETTSTMTSIDSIKNLFLLGELFGLTCIMAGVSHAYVQA